MSKVVTRSNVQALQPSIASALSGAILSPGMLAEKTAGVFVPHATAAGSAQKAIVQIKLTTGGTFDTAYASGETVSVGYYSSGVPVNFIVAAGAAAILAEDALESAGDGTLRKVVTSAATADTSRDSIVAYAEQDLDNSGGATALPIMARTA